MWQIDEVNGGVRFLGIPTVQDRLIQQAIAQVLSKIYEPSFSENSFGFRHRRGAKDAITKSKQYINQGNRWVVDMDLEKFFNKVNHDILMNKLENKLKLKVNTNKSAIDFVSRRKFLGFSFYFAKSGAEIRIHKIYQKI